MGNSHENAIEEIDPSFDIPASADTPVDPLANVTWDDVEVVNDCVKSIAGKPVENYTAKQLRHLCSLLKMRGLKNATKQEFIEALNTQAVNRLANPLDIVEPSHEQQHAEHVTKRSKKVNRTFRLINVLCSDVFVNYFRNLEQNGSENDDPSAGNAPASEQLWRNVKNLYDSSEQEFGQLMFDDDVFVQKGIDPSNAMIISWKQMMQIWTELKSTYKTTVVNYHQSDKSITDFFTLCGSRIDVYYLRKYVEAKPSLIALIDAELQGYLSINGVNYPTVVKDHSPAGQSANNTPKPKEVEVEPTSKEVDVEIPMKTVEVPEIVGDVGARVSDELSSSELRAEFVKEKLRLMQESEDRERKRFKFEEEMHSIDLFDKLRRLINETRNDIQQETDPAYSKQLQTDLKHLLATKRKLWH